MTNSWRIPVNFQDQWNQLHKRVMRLERRPAVTNATQILGPGAGAWAVLVEDWNEEACTFNGIFYSNPNAFNSPDDLLSLPPGDYWWMGETFGTDEQYGFQRLTRFRVDPDAGGDWDEYRRRFYLQGDEYAYTTWEAV